MHLSSWGLKCYYSQRNSLGTDRVSMCIMNANVWIDKKVIFSIKKYLPIQSMISSCSENSGVILTLSFPDNINYHKELFF